MLYFTVNVQESVMSVLDIIEKTTLGKVLQKCLSGVKVMDCLKAYLSDFVHMVYHVTSQEEHGVQYLCIIKDQGFCENQFILIVLKNCLMFRLHVYNCLRT